jgi:hypothetical protein
MEFSGWGGGRRHYFQQSKTYVQFTGTELHNVCRVLGGGYARVRCVDAMRVTLLILRGSGRRKNNVLMALDTAAICPAKHFPYLGVGRVVLFAKICRSSTSWIFWRGAQIT